MTSSWLALAWCTLIVAAALARRPRRNRVTALVASAAATRARTRPSPITALGRVLLRLSGDTGSPTQPEATQRAQRVGRTAVASVLPLAPLGFPRGAFAGACCAAAMWWLPAFDRRRIERRRVARLEAELPDAVDLLLLAVGAGLTVPLALDAVARRGTGDLAAEFGAVVAASRQGHRLADALDALPARTGEAVRPLAAALAASERYGAALGPALERLALDVRATRRRRAEEAARRVPVKLLFPLVLCVLPAFALLTVAPLIASALQSLRL
jgi:tight adherence protein C